MNRDDVIRMAREADREWDCDRDMVEWLERFVDLIAAASASVEREACAKVADDWGTPHADRIAAAIRARGQA